MTDHDDLTRQIQSLQARDDLEPWEHQFLSDLFTKVDQGFILTPAEKDQLQELIAWAHMKEEL